MKEAVDILFEDGVYKIVKVEYDLETKEATIKEVNQLAATEPLAAYEIQKLFAHKIISLR